MDAQAPSRPTVGSLFAGIGGFDLGFEQAGFKTEWQVEIADIPRAVLADRFPHAKQFTDVRTCLPDLWRTDVIIGGFPCQDVSTAGKRRGLAGERTGLFFDALNIVNTLKPRWVVLENVTGLLNSNDGKDFQTVIQSLAECGYVGCWRVLDARYFGVPTKRRRVFVVAGLGEQPPIEFMADAGPTDRLAGKAAAGSPWADAHPTLLAGFPSGTNIDISGANICLVADGRSKMVERGRTVADNGLRKGLDASNFAEARAAGNAVCPQVARWIAEKLIKTF
ncbi:DNA cytosine methyltransferase [Neisseria dumasiana]|uniref:DNA (cytosine-5-)-methyltransferase n=1 Tax=Neisseria dumasiana TaxID=1931275 RepID=A0ABX3WMU6_9NEIS|nr:DNA (cytosine-5-)-methyltransferase [Neisseria dumasiana]OSI36072.1 DNA (cytosine-5-)-methyltransferase [Neisseria dumasiana]UOO83567.1 DNA (cytosine-5-)-methyltransferase [Neisseria dumasiana]